MAKPLATAAVVPADTTLTQLIESREPVLLHTEVLPELLSLGWGLVQRGYFFERTEKGTWRRGAVSVRDRPLTLAFAQQDAEEVRVELARKGYSAACLLYSLEVGPGVAAPKEWRVVTRWVSAEESVCRAHHITRKGTVRSVFAHDALDELVPVPLRAHPQALASLEREYRLVAHGLDDRLRALLGNLAQPSQPLDSTVQALESVVLEVSARRADDVLASYLCVTTSVQEQARELVQRMQDESSEREKRQARQFEERIRRLQHQLDIALKRTTVLEAQLLEARTARAGVPHVEVRALPAEAAHSESQSPFQQQCTALLRRSTHWKPILGEGPGLVGELEQASLKQA